MFEFNGECLYCDKKYEDGPVVTSDPTYSCVILGCMEQAIEVTEVTEEKQYYCAIHSDKTANIKTRYHICPHLYYIDKSGVQVPLSSVSLDMWTPLINIIYCTRKYAKYQLFLEESIQILNILDKFDAIYKWFNANISTEYLREIYGIYRRDAYYYHVHRAEVKNSYSYALWELETFKLATLNEDIYKKGVIISRYLLEHGGIWDTWMTELYEIVTISTYIEWCMEWAGMA
jgi:hypothetical protein